MPGPEPRPPLGRLWEYEGPGPIGSAVAVIGGLVYVTDTVGDLACLDLGTGSVRWRRKIANGPLSSPTVARATVYVGTPAALVALAAGDGKTRWTFSADGPIEGAPTVVGTSVLVASEAGTVTALDAASGQPTWRATLGATIDRTLAASGDSVYVPLHGGTVAAIRLTDGSVQWRTNTGIAGGVGTAVAADGRVYVSTGLDTTSGAAREIVALDTATGAVEWRYASPAGALVYSPAIADDLAVVVGEDSRVVALDAATGTARWTFTTRGPDEAVAAIVGTTVVVPDDAHHLYGLDLSSGRQRWVASFAGLPYGPTVAAGIVLVPTSLGVVDAIGGQP